MKVIRARNKVELLAEIGKDSGDHGEVYINLRPTLDIVSGITKSFPKVQKITCPPSLHTQTSKKVFKYLGDTGIRLEPGGFNVGRPKKYDAGMVAQVSNLRTQGTPAKHIAEQMNMPLRTVYFYLQQK